MDPGQSMQRLVGAVQRPVGAFWLDFDFALWPAVPCHQLSTAALLGVPDFGDRENEGSSGQPKLGLGKPPHTVP